LARTAGQLRDSSTGSGHVNHFVGDGIAMNYHVEPIPRLLMAAFVAAHHYAVRVPPHCLLSLGCFAGTDLVGVASWGYCVRPRHTIQRLFPSLGTGDYYELNRLCMLDSEPRNGESHFLRLCREYIRGREPGRVVFFSWADGMRGKPGYVYQADNWLYGGFIRTEFYVTAAGEVVHPRQVTTRCGRRDRAFTRSVGLRRVRGRQFRYCHFLCGRSEVHRLLAEHLTAEVPVKTQGRNRALHEWKPRANAFDNHWFDCLVGCVVGAAMCGVTLPGVNVGLVRRRPRGRVRLSALVGR